MQFKKAKEIFPELNLNFDVPYFNKKTDLVPEVDKNYIFDISILKAILAGISFNKRTFIYGPHGTGKSTHIEQVCAKLNFECIRVNLDANISRTELIGRDMIALKDGKQIIEFKEGILPWSIKKDAILILDEYDAARPETLFTIQKLLEKDGNLLILEENKVIKPSEMFRIFATANTIGSGDESGIYVGSQIINQGQLDRWDIIVKAKYISEEKEVEIVSKRFPSILEKYGLQFVKNLIKLANLIRNAFENGDLSVLFSTRGVCAFCDNLIIFESQAEAFEYSYLNRLNQNEKGYALDLYQRCFG